MEGKTHISEKKKESLKNLVRDIKEYKITVISDILNLPSVQFQEIRRKLRDKIKIRVIKKRVLMKALEKFKKDAPKIEKLMEEVKESVAILFSNEDVFTLASRLSDCTMPAKAKPGQIAEKNIEIKAGPTDFPPGPMITELSNVGIKTGIKGGKIIIKEDKVVARAGEPIKPATASVLGKFDIKPFKIGLKANAVYDSKEKKIYFNIIIDKGKTLEELKQTGAGVLSFAIYINYPTKETIIFLLANAENCASYLKNKFVKEGEEKKEEIKEKPKNKSEKEEGEVTINEKKEEEKKKEESSADKEELNKKEENKNISDSSPNIQPNTQKNQNQDKEE